MVYLTPFRPEPPSTEYLSHVQDGDGVTTTCRDRLTGRPFTVRSKYLLGADGSNSKVAADAGLPFEGRMGVGGSMNILFKADLSRFVAHRPSVLYWVVQPGADVGGIGMGLVRMVRPWNEWLIVWGYDIDQPPPDVDEAFAKKVVRDLVGSSDVDPQIQSISTWTVNNMYATRTSQGRVFCLGDAIHRHPPSNGLGSNTSIQDAFNLAWKLAFVLKGHAGEHLLNSYTEERAPVAKQIVTRANQSITEFGPIFRALGLLDTIDPVKMQANMDARCDDTAEAEAQRSAIREAIAFKKYEFDAHGVEMNQRYRSGAVLADGQPEPAFARDAELHYHPTTWPGARLPHAWIYAADGTKTSTLDLCGHGRFTLLTGIGGGAWVEAAREIAAETATPLSVEVIGPRCAWQDLGGDWARTSEIRDGDAILVRPDHHVAWRSQGAVADAQGALRSALNSVLAR